MIRAAHPNAPSIDALASLAERHGISLFALAYGFVRALPGVSTVLLGMSRREHLDENLKIIERGAAVRRAARRDRRHRGLDGHRDRSGVSAERVVVVGSGPTGAMAAARLVQRGLPVTMLDAGTHAPRGLLVKVAGKTVVRMASKRELVGDRTDREGGGAAWFSSLSLGGLSNYWTAAVPRFAPSDFTEGARVDERYRWPVAYDDLVDHYEYAEQALDITAGHDAIPGVPANRARYSVMAPPGWREVIGRANQQGHAVGILPMAKGAPWMIARRTREFGSYHCVVLPMLGAPSFELRTGTRVTRLCWNPTLERVDAVEYVDAGTGLRRTLPCAAVVVAAGAIDSTALLLSSTSADFPNGLGNNGGIIGRYLHDHPREWFLATADRPLRALAHPVYIARDTGDPPTPMLTTSLTLGLSSGVARVKTFLRGSVEGFGVQVFGTMIPQDTIGVSLGAAANGEAPRPRIDITFDAATHANLDGARDRLRAVFADSGIVVCPSVRLHPINPGEAVHYGGTVRMHESPAYGALDGRGRLHEVTNVVVADSSAFTTGPEKNPTLTAMALASRAACLLADDLERGRVG